MKIKVKCDVCSKRAKNVCVKKGQNTCMKHFDKNAPIKEVSE